MLLVLGNLHLWIKNVKREFQDTISPAVIIIIVVGHSQSEGLTFIWNDFSEQLIKSQMVNSKDGSVFQVAPQYQNWPGAKISVFGSRFQPLWRLELLTASIIVIYWSLDYLWFVAWVGPFRIYWCVVLAEHFDQLEATSHKEFWSSVPPRQLIQYEKMSNKSQLI